MLETLQNKVDHIAPTKRINAVYLMYQEGTRRVYIGSSGQPGLRAGRHIWLLKKQGHYNKTFQDLYNVNPEFYTVYYTVGSRDEAYTLEQALIDYYTPSGLMINHALNAKAPNKGRVFSQEQLAKMRAAGLGRIVSAETRAKISKGSIGRVQSEHTRALLSVAKKGKPQPDHIAELCRERNRLRSKSISVNGVIYPSIREASRQLGMARDNVKTRVKSINSKWKDWFYV